MTYSLTVPFFHLTISILMGLPRAGWGPLLPIILLRGALRWPSIEESACSAGETRSVVPKEASTEMATHSSSPAWRIPPPKESRLQSMGSQRMTWLSCTKQYQPEAGHDITPCKCLNFIYYETIEKSIKISVTDTHIPTTQNQVNVN